MYKRITEYLKNNLSKKRYAHTLAVAEECLYYADVFGLCDTDKDILYRAALFHDITKEKTPEEQRELCRVYHIEYDEAYLSTPALFHSLTGGRYAQELFPDLCDQKITDLTNTHTTGREDMSLLQKILFIADSTEPTRKHESCIELRSFFHDNAANADPHILLDRTIVKSLDNTIAFLMSKGKAIDVNTVKARNYLLKQRGH